MIEATMSDAVLARLEALTARLDEQAVRLETLDVLEAKFAGLEAENARLTAALAAPGVADIPLAPATTNRRGMLRKVLSASAAAALLLVAKEAATAEAGAKVTVTAASAAGYGVVAQPGTGDPSAPTNLPSSGVGVVGYSFAGFVPAFPAAANGDGAGVWGTADGGIGVLGTSSNGNGVWGISASNTDVRGDSTSNVGVRGISTNNAGVYGSGPIGVFATGTGTAAVYGANNAGYGVWGQSSSFIGVRGESVGNVAVQAFSTNWWGLHAKSPVYAGVFEGNVYVTGKLTVLGGVNGASALGAGTTGERATVEDFGEGTLVNGKATVALDKGFVDQVQAGQYHVVVTPHDASGRPLAVVARRRDGFDVQELAGGATDTAGGVPKPGSGRPITFSYRVVARQAAPAGARQEPLAPPDFSNIKPGPKPPEPPQTPEPRSGPDRRDP